MLITSILLLKTNQTQILRTTLIGSILSNMHLILGLGFMVGGMKQKEQKYNIDMGQLFGTMLLLAMAGLIIPSVLALLKTGVTQSNVLSLSRVIALVLLLVYGVFLFFELKSHKHVFQTLGEDETKEGEHLSAVHNRERNIDKLREQFRLGDFRQPLDSPKNVARATTSLKRGVSKNASAAKTMASMGAGLGAVATDTIELPLAGEDMSEQEKSRQIILLGLPQSEW